MSRMNMPRQSGHGRSRDSGRSGGGSSIEVAGPVKFYLDEAKQILNPDLLDSLADEQAKKIHGRINSAQLRRFFGEVKQLNNRLVNQQPFERLFPLVKMIKSKVWYAVNPRQEKIPKEFASFLLGGIDQIKEQKDFEAFVLYFEAVVGFMYGKGLVQG